VLSEYYVAVKNDAAARQMLLPLLNDQRAAASANLRLAALDYKGGHADDAFKRLASVLDKDQSNLDALLLKSTILLSEKKTDEALASANAAVERHPSSTAALFVLGRVQTLRNQPEVAVHAFEEVLRLNPRATAAKVALAQLQLAAGHSDTSVVLAAEALANEPNNADAQLVYTRGLLRRGELDRAGAELKQLSARYPRSAVLHAETGMLLGLKHDYSGARKAFEEALQLQPANIEALDGLVAIDLATKDYASARARVDARIASAPTAQLLTLAARTYGATGDLAGAERLLRRALDLDSGNLTAYGGLGQLYAMQGKLAEARAEFEKLAQRSPKSVSALTMVAIIAEAQGDMKTAREGFEHVLQVDPEAAVASNNLAWIYANNGGNLDVALQLAQTAHKHLPDLAEINDTLGFIYYKKNLSALAITSLKLSADKDPANAIYQYHLGLAYAGEGDADHARQALKRALVLKPAFDGAPHAKELLASLAK
jgi:tetratricopeptide (TPR) repeat protein